MKANIKTALMLILTYLILAVPFKVMSVIPGFTDIRPVTMLGPIYALFYGVPGCTIFAVMNVVMDAVSGELMWTSIPGLIANFVGPFLILIYWKRFAKTAPRLKKLGNILHFSLTLILAAVIEAAIITPWIAILYPNVDWMLFFMTVTINNSLFAIVFGIPLIILMKEELGFKQKGLLRIPDKKNN
jgi:hypothetical protein